MRWWLAELGEEAGGLEGSQFQVMWIWMGIGRF